MSLSDYQIPRNHPGYTIRDCKQTAQRYTERAEEYECEIQQLQRDLAKITKAIETSTNQEEIRRLENAYNFTKNWTLPPALTNKQICLDQAQKWILESDRIKSGRPKPAEKSNAQINDGPASVVRTL